ncbi:MULTISPECIES: acetyl-CoA hydrolase/transferase C-terminal domain-containing protein [unclassified Lysobacter]|uniref:acetyl-CoA hydrolase/transferase C-terminal domain-containing protein n=1 Tax=unclassified Lysobacter TaxID=2635362 RepID=UPI0006F75A8A|nr:MULTISPECIES: acetyl-CoA hydrolase/transferase C-terminal domain-containing protein [unclassified Lysobacter]KQZ60348.1 acetyl-CoA hydrolase [Lysobacter sp. Root559]KRC38789.1 acetyl-CoA hydrolase [Lysobacter sp. Root76]KRD71007.1 acetyl-CoA hydrolase [Lysobacter sp. Root96]
MTAPARFERIDDAVDFLLARTQGPLHVGAPLGLGKPHRLLNALYARIAADPSRALHLYTALSLDPPGAGKGLEGRFVGPFARRHFGDDFPRLAYVDALKRNTLPAHIEIEEFYLQSGALLNSPLAQQRYASLNYTHVARALADRGVNAIVQKVARRDGDTRLSLSCNTDLTQDAVDAIVARGLPRPLLIAEVDPQLPWLGGSATVAEDYFDAVVTPPGPHPKLFGLPRQPVTDADYAIGFYASTLVRDGGTLQIGIGALADALCHALALRHADNAGYRRVLAALDPALASRPDLAPFAEGLYGCSEMINEGFRRLVEVGVIRRKVVDDEALMRRIADGRADDADRAVLERDGEYLHGGFYLGSPEFYEWLRHLPEDQRRGIGMRRISEVNELYGGHEALERLQRRDARFFNTCMMATALGAAVSDGLADGRVVSGVGGQYNFVAMAHALPDARSVLMLRATRDAGGENRSNLVWNYGHTTIPRHLRDIYISEYGIADLRGRADEDCVQAMAAIADARYGRGLLDTARREGKLRADFSLTAAARRNTPEHLRQALAPLRREGLLPDYPLGSDFTPVEERLVRALGWLKAATATRTGKLGTVARALLGGSGDDAEALARMDLAAPSGLGARLEARLLALALRETRS